MPLQVEGSRIQVLGPVASSNMMGSLRRTRELSDIAPQYIAKSGLCNASELESSRGGSIRIQHVTGLNNGAEEKSRFPKLDECAHFHYEHVEIGPLQVSIIDDDDLKPLSNETDEGKWWSLSVTSQNKSWLIRRSYDNFRMLDQQLHRCIYDRKFSELVELPSESIEEQENIHKLLSDYVSRFSTIAGSLINCGPVLNWLELDNRGHRLLVPDTDNCPINTPAVAAAYSVKRYSAQAPDEISFEVGDMISVIDMPPPEESIWWRGKRGFQVGFFPCECVAVIGDKVPRNIQFSPHLSQPTKPVLRKHGKLIAFFRSFILSRPSRRRLKQSGILKERVFGCDLGEHLLNSGHEIPMVLKCCVEFIETNGLVDGIYRLSGVTSNIQKLRNAFDEDRIPALYEDESILQDVHSVASLLKMYFRELPNPLCTYQLYHQFVGAVQASQGDDTRLLRMRDVVQKLPPPHYRTLEYLMRHLSRVSEKGHETGMTSRNVAIVWAPNLLRCKELEVGGVAALQGVGVQAVVTEFLVCYADLIFCDGLPSVNLPPQQVSSKKCRPKSLAISTPTKLLSLEEARTRALLQAAGNSEQDYIEVGGGPASLPAKYHTVIELPGNSRKRLGSKRSPIGWKLLFGKSGRGSQSRKEAERKASTPSDVGLRVDKVMTELDLTQNRRRLRPAKSVESLNSNRNSATLDFSEPLEKGLGSPEDTLSPMLLRNPEGKSNGHNRSVSHESYFDQLQDQKEDSALDISEIQVNFDLEESEMRIFSEDETLASIGSGSLISNNSPRILYTEKSVKSLVSSVNKRLSYPKLGQTEDRFPSSQSADPSPKKQKTSDGIPLRSKLEEQLSNSMGDIQFIDSVSPDQVLVQAEVHPIQSPSPVSSISQMSSSLLAPSSPILPHIPHLRRPLSQTMTTQSTFDNSSSSLENNAFARGQANKSNASLDSFSATRAFRPLSSNKMGSHSPLTSPTLAEATVSDNESFSLQSSQLTTPDTPVCPSYTHLIDFEESSTSNLTTPDFDVNDKTRKSSSETENLDKKMIKANLEFDKCKNIGKEVAKFEEEISSENISLDPKLKCENLTRHAVKTEGLKREEVTPKPEERKPKPVHPYANIPIVKPEVEPRKLLETSFDLKEHPAKTSNRNSVISIKYECISTESSSESLISVNKSDEGSLLLESKSKSRQGQTPVFESTESNGSLPKCDSPRNPDVSTLQKKFEESEMDLLTECSTWLQTQLDFCATENTNTKPATVFPPRSSPSDRGSSGEEKTKIGDNGAEQGQPSFSSIENLLNVNFNDNFDGGKAVSVEDTLTVECDASAKKTLLRVSNDTALSRIIIAEREEGHSGENLENGTDAEDDGTNLLVTDFPLLDDSFQTGKKLLETNLDDLGDLDLASNEVKENVTFTAGKVEEESNPIPGKRCSPQKSSSSGNVRQLLTKFEISPTTEKNLIELRMDFDVIRQGNRVRQTSSLNEESSSAREHEERPKTLERMSTNRKTGKDSGLSAKTQLEKSKSGSQIDETRSDSKGEVFFNCDFDLSDPLRRERIEKYKEKRRNYLREKYRSDSFKNDKDDFLLKIKQRHAHKVEGDVVVEGGKEGSEKGSPSKRPGPSLPVEKKNPSVEKSVRKNLLLKSLESPSRDPCRRSFSAEVSGRPSPRYELPTVSSSVRDSSRRSTFVRSSSERKSASDLRSPKLSPEKVFRSPQHPSSERTLADNLSPSSLGFSYPRRRMTDPSRPSSAGKSSETPSGAAPSDKSSFSVNTSDELPDEDSSPSSPSCVKEVTALFEKGEDAKANKQYLSSV